MSVGHWSAGDFCDRFAPPGYHSDDPSFRNDFEGQCRRTKAAGVDAIEIHQSVFEKTLNGDLDPRGDRARAERLPRRARHDASRRATSTPGRIRSSGSADRAIRIRRCAAPRSTRS